MLTKFSRLPVRLAKAVFMICFAGLTCHEATAEPFWKSPPPEEWAALLQEALPPGECPTIAGHYRAEGEMIRPDYPGAPRSRALPDFIVFRNLGRKGLSQLDHGDFPLVTADAFEIRQQPEWFLVAVNNLKDETTVRSVKYSKNEGDYACEGGWLILPLKHYTGGSEGSTRKTETLIRITRLADGSVLYYERFRNRTRGIFTSSDTTSESYYRFPKAGN